MRAIKHMAASAVLIFCFVWLASCGGERVNGTPADVDGAIRYRDASGDYLFVRNQHETLRMAYTVRGGADGVHIRLAVPEALLLDAFSPWDPGRVMALADAGRGDTVCVEAWDMYKNGVYYKTVYEIGIDRGGGM